MIAQRADRVIHRGMRGDDRDRQQRIRPPQRLQQLDAGHARHLDVGHHQIPGLVAGEPQCGSRVGRMHYLVAIPHGQDLDDETGRLEVVLDQEYPALRCDRVDGIHVAGLSSLSCGRARRRRPIGSSRPAPAAGRPALAAGPVVPAAGPVAGRSGSRSP
jgi:hypothetical protein